MGLEPLTIDAALSRNVAANPTGEALVFKGERIDWRTLDAWSDRLARAFLAHGIARGQKVATFMANNCEWVAILYALGKIGATVVPVNFRYKARELADVLNQSDACLLIATTTHGDRDHVTLIADGLRESEVDCFIGLGAGPLPDVETAIDWAAFESSADAVGDGALREAKAAVSPDDVLIIQYTSGTTSFPKGVQLRQDQMLRSGTGMSNRLHMSAGDRFFSPMPFFHIGGSAASILTAMVCGATLCFLDYFTAQEALDILAGERCTHMCGVDTMFVDMMALDGFQDADLSAIRTGWTIYNEAVFKTFPGMMNVYALSECSSVVTICDCDEPLDRRRDTCGLPLEGVEVRIVDRDTFEELPPDTPGLITVRGWCTTSGYYNLPELNEQLYLAGGWLNTGDYGKRLAGGELVYLGRLKDVLRVGGENVASVEVEAIINNHPAVLRSALVPVSHPRLGEVPCAFVLLRDDATAKEAEIIAYCREQLANFKVPRHVVFVSDFPMTGSGKIQKTSLTEEAESRFAPAHAAG